MKKLTKFLIAVTFGFYFMLEMPGDYPGTRVTMIYSGYQSKAQCEAQRDEMKELVKAVGATAAFSLCSEERQS